ncbi:hypothetical protein FQN60_016582, partial [Etheostoma spectabile]
MKSSVMLAPCTLNRNESRSTGEFWHCAPNV